MSTAHRLRRITATRGALRSILAHLDAAERHWAELEPGMRAQSFTPPTSTHRITNDDDGEGRHTIADPTGDAAAVPSAARRAEVELDVLLERVARSADEAARIVTRWAVALPVKADELQQLERQADPGCEVVGRIARANGPAHWEPVHSTTDLGGLLDRKYRLGRWAYDFARANGRLPTVAETTSHVGGGRVMVAS